MILDRLRAEGYDTQHQDGVDVAIHDLAHNKYDLIILDLMLNGRSGLEVCKHLRDKGDYTPILILTAKGQIADKVEGLKLGADDYLTKPFDSAELLARIEAVLRRSSNSASSAMLGFADVTIDVVGVEVQKAGVKLDLSLKEYSLLKFLIVNKGRLLSRDEILNEVWGYEESPTTRTVDTHIGWLRQKIESNPKDPKHILTVHGFGYKFVE